MDKCSYCFEPTDEILDLGFLPPVNVMDKVGENIQVNTSYPLRLTFCKNCFLTQIGDEIDESLVFPESYPYLSGTTRILRENFTEQFNELINFKPAKPNQLVIDIGSNDGTLLSNYKNDFTVFSSFSDISVIETSFTICSKYFNI